MIEFQNVSFSYRTPESTGDSRCVSAGIRGIDLVVGEGKCVLVCGGSGCGKTTITRIANGLAPVFFPGDFSGRVLVDGQDAANMESWEMAVHTGSVFQNPRTQFFNVDSTGEVAFALESMAWPEESVRMRTRETIAELGLEGLADRSIFSLSGGEKQRIAYASVWAPHPNNLVLDEPTSNLDMEAISDLRGYLLDAKTKGVAVLAAEHRLWWLADVADTVVIMRDGRIARTMTGPAFRALPASDIRAMGLRARDLSTVRARDGAGKASCGMGIAGEAAVGATGGTSGAAGSATSDAAIANGDMALGVDFTDDAMADGSRGRLVSIDAIRASYGKREVLNKVSCSIRFGSVVALVGRNGAGKSTLCRTLVGLHGESDGVIRLGGKAVAVKDRLRASSMVFQDVNYQLFADSVETEVTFGLEAAKRPSVKGVRGILDGLGLSDLAERHPATLSGGQKQRLAVAACIASGKRLLVFDEPTSGLDLESMVAVADLVRSLAAEGRAVLVVTHDLEFIACACDRALLMEDGCVSREAAVEGDLAAVRELLARGA